MRKIKCGVIMRKNSKMILGILVVLIVIIGAVVAYTGIEKSVTDRESFKYAVDNISSAPVDTVDSDINNTKPDSKLGNVMIEIEDSTITPKSVSIIITDNNENQYCWGVEFRVQKRVNGNWKNLKYVSEEPYWIEIAYELNEDNQLTQELDIEAYYGILSKGTYRIVKPVYDNGYIDIYSNEFEIK